MKKIMTLAGFPLAALALSAPAANASANSESRPARDVDAANSWNFTEAEVCLQELAVVPLDGARLDDTIDHCANGNVLDPRLTPHRRQTAPIADRVVHIAWSAGPTRRTIRTDTQKSAATSP
ncbi:hypothetical protein [Streptomyces sp. PU-14G]|uniref:hypothetical protein n=1 Tax=Streptomyces sp. PU-14G TaxID=2800808 RepID=UPI0034E0263D